MKSDGIHTMVAPADMSAGARKMRNFYAMKPDTGIFQQEFGFYSLDLWREQGYVKEKEDLDRLFGFDPQGKFPLRGLGWTEAEFCPRFEEKILQDIVLQPVKIRHVFFKSATISAAARKTGTGVRRRKRLWRTCRSTRAYSRTAATIWKRRRATPARTAKRSSAF